MAQEFTNTELLMIDEAIRHRISNGISDMAWEPDRKRQALIQQELNRFQALRAKVKQYIKTT